MKVLTLHPLAVVLLPLFAGCGGDCARRWYADRDGDGFGDRADLVRACEAPEGFVAEPTDCDDNDGQVHPGRADECNGVDDDCDGVVDPDEVEWLADADGDGFGTALLPIVACTPPDGFVALSGDCDDADARIHPGGVEICDGRDQDCDGIADEGAPGVLTYYPDDDGDGWGAKFSGLVTCAPSAGFILIGQDCDDNAWWISPEQVEVCDGLDNDCDGYTDDADPGGAGQASSWWLDLDDDGWGAGFTNYACTVPSNGTTSFGDCDDDDDTAYPGADEACDGVDHDCDGQLGEDDSSLDPSLLTEGFADLDDDGLGDPAAPLSLCALGAGAAANDLDCDDLDPWVGTDEWLPDLDGDAYGAGSVVAGTNCVPPTSAYAPAATPTDCDDGAPTVNPGAPDFCGDGLDQDCTGIDPACSEAATGYLALSDESRAWAEGQTATDEFGTALASGDVDADGRPDLLIGAPGASGGQGQVTVHFGPMPEFSSVWSPDLTVTGEPGDRLGASLASPVDVDFDGRPELVVGAPGADGGNGLVSVFHWNDDGTTTLIASLGSTTAGAAVGQSIARAGDPDANGTQDYVVGAPGEGRIVRTTFTSGLHLTNDLADLVINAAAGSGASVAGGSDVDGDGIVDLAAGFPDSSNGGVNAGDAFLIDAATVGVGAPATFAFASVQGQAGQRLAAAMSIRGDLDGDGANDLTLAAPGDAAGGTDAGVVLLFPSPTLGLLDTDATFALQGTTDAALADALTVRDLDGDAADDLVIGARNATISGPGSGGVFVFFGPLSGTVPVLAADVVWFENPGEGAGAALLVDALDADAPLDLAVGLPDGLAPGRVWLVPGAAP